MKTYDGPMAGGPDRSLSASMSAVFSWMLVVSASTMSEDWTRISSAVKGLTSLIHD